MLLQLSYYSIFILWYCHETLAKIVISCAKCYIIKSKVLFLRILAVFSKSGKSTQCMGTLSMLLFITTGYLRHAFRDRPRFAETYKYLITLNTVSNFLCRSCPVTAQVSRAFQFSPAKVCKAFHVSIISSPLRIQVT